MPSTTSTKFTYDSVKSSKSFTLYRLEDELVIARKHAVRRTLSEENQAELRFMRQLDHEVSVLQMNLFTVWFKNVNKFLGLSIDGPDFMSIWRFCSRGSIQDLIDRGNVNIDAFFIYSLVRDLAEVNTNLVKWRFKQLI